MGVNSLPETVTRQRRDCDLNPGPSAPESSTLTTRLPSHPTFDKAIVNADSAPVGCCQLVGQLECMQLCQIRAAPVESL